MVPADAVAKAAVAIVAATFAVFVLLGGPRRAPNVFLAAFLALIAGNQAAETLRSTAATYADNLLWFRVATVFAALDPVFLHRFAETTGGGRGSRSGAVVTVAGCLLALLAPLARHPYFVEGRHAESLWLSYSVVLTVYTVLAYVSAGALVVRAGAAPGFARRLLLPAFAVVVVPVLPRVSYDLGFSLIVVRLLGSTVSDLGLALFAIGPIVAVGVAAVVLAVRGRRAEAAALGLGAIVALGVSSPAVFNMFGPSPAFAVFVARGAAPLRWLVFGGFVSVAVLRHDLLGMSLAARRRASRALLALAFAGAALALLVASALALGRDPFDPRVLGGGLLAAAVVSQGFRRLADRVAEIVYGIPAQVDRAAALDTYRAAVVQAAAEGRDLASDASLARLRGELGLDAREAAVLARMASEGAESAPLTAGRRVAGRYRVEALLGRGGSGRVFRARDELLERDVVLKEIPHDGGFAGSALREARLAGSVEHPNVVRALDSFERPGASVLVCEYVPGGSLADRLRAGPLPPAEAERVLRGVLDGLAAVHARGIVHRDLKPANVLLDADGTPKIADFGVARARSGQTVGFGEQDAFVGTPEFMAPEQRRGERATAAADVHAVGLLARVLLPGPWRPEVEAVLRRALEEDPARRWRDALEMRSALSSPGT